MTDDVVTSTNGLIDLPIPGTGRTYKLRAPTFGDVGDMAARQAGAPVPNDAVFVDALCEAVKSSGLPETEIAEHLSAVARAEEARDLLDGVYAAHGPDRKQWDAEARGEIRDAERADRTAQKGRARAEWAVRDSEALSELRRHQSMVGRREQADVVMLCVVGPGAPADADAVRAMPAVDVVTIYQRGLSLMRPSPAAEKN